MTVIHLYCPDLESHSFFKMFYESRCLKRTLLFHYLQNSFSAVLVDGSNLVEPIPIRWKFHAFLWYVFYVHLHLITRIFTVHPVIVCIAFSMDGWLTVSVASYLTTHAFEAS